MQAVPELRLPKLIETIMTLRAQRMQHPVQSQAPGKIPAVACQGIFKVQAQENGQNLQLSALLSTSE